MNWQQTYNGEVVNAFPDEDDDGEQDDVRTRQEIATNSGLPIDSPSVETAFREQFADVPDDIPKPVIDLQDAKPTDEGTLSMGFHLFDNPGYLELPGDLLRNDENGRNEHEGDASDPNPGDGGDLASEIQVEIRYDTEDNTTKIVEGSLNRVLSLLQNGFLLDGNPDSAEEGCFPNSTTVEIALEWELPRDVGNEIQTDKVGFDIGVRAVQCRGIKGVDLVLEINPDLVDEIYQTPNPGDNTLLPLSVPNRDPEDADDVRLNRIYPAVWILWESSVGPWMHLTSGKSARSPQGQKKTRSSCPRVVGIPLAVS